MPFLRTFRYFPPNFFWLYDCSSRWNTFICLNFHLTSTIKENEPVAEVTGVKAYDDKFEISIAIDKNKVQKYYASAVAGDDIGYWPEALFGIIWKKQSINSGEEQVYTESKSYDFRRIAHFAGYFWVVGVL